MHKQTNVEEIQMCLSFMAMELSEVKKSLEKTFQDIELLSLSEDDTKDIEDLASDIYVYASEIKELLS